ncbi:hypothetical protein C6A87_000265 [Mycobacterium sp. ITM-2016-00317]|uniref:hypothetical protein n=1 Tax=Mycobacterium sp. ITM-2016-00317 TaxID=2099694 RepID=UPI00287F97F6|nr:hypothetical protein [Mycobacterium sp. ITM-2016-00317]WNG87771.1 hypothetical protein C6A87_000265 [Mycobacterium sp. ITM-2016-00317]
MLIAMVPKPVWIFIGILAGCALVTWLVYSVVSAEQKRRDAAEERARADRAKQAAAAKREREERARKEKQRRIATLGKANAERVDKAVSAVKRVSESEAARAGWLGDVDFSTDIQWITGNFKQAHDLRRVADKLSALDKPSADDRRILAEANSTIARMVKAAIERVDLIEKCAKEAQHIDESLRTEREDARLAEQRAELHAKLGAMLYGIEAAPTANPTSSAVDAVMARVQAYREIKNEIEKARVQVSD